MRIAFVAAECDPIVKAGEIADVVASLPRELARLGHQCSIYIPGYASIDPRFRKEARWIRTVEIRDTELPARAEIERITSRDIAVNLVQCPDLFGQHGDPYEGGASDPSRWALFQLAVLESLSKETEAVDVIHLHDWPTGLLPVYRSLRYKDSPVGKAGLLFTIHNLANAGKFTKDQLQKIGLPDWLFDREQLEFFGEVSMLKAGILWSTMIGTVSPTYAKEIQSELHGCGFEGILQKRVDDLTGVLNGIDTEVWDPTVCEIDRDEGVWPAFTDRDWTSKSEHRATLCSRFNLKQTHDRPLFAYVGRLMEQRGIAALLDVVPRIVDSGGQIFVLGQGDESYEKQLLALAAQYKENMSVQTGYQPLLAKRIFAASDFFIMPSKFEPCGLSQMIACRYGSLPIVAHTGGLADTIRDTDDYSDGNGLTFQAPATMEESKWLPVAERELSKAIDRAVRLYQDKDRFDLTRRRAMRRDFSCGRSARRYEEIYYEAMRREKGEAGHHGP
ncbi:MAG: glycogen synthase [Planctomycetes bacterium]|nr:glycogen synthase [Planctomycetota bacterium]